VVVHGVVVVGVGGGSWCCCCWLWLWFMVLLLLLLLSSSSSPPSQQSTSFLHYYYLQHRHLILLLLLQKLYLYIAGIIHDVDHRGKNNAFMLQSNTPLANLYTTSTMEWHHFHQGIFILEVLYSLVSQSISQSRQVNISVSP